MPTGTVVHTVRPDEPGKATCGFSVHANRAGQIIDVDTSRPLGRNPAGLQLRWCGKCLGVLAVDAGHGEQLADHVVRGTTATPTELNPTTTTTGDTDA